MLRRSHKKTKKGSKCEECRRRHIRCDQRRIGGCLNCQNADRVCTYRDQIAAPPSASSTSSTSPSSQGLTPPSISNTPSVARPPQTSSSSSTVAPLSVPFDSARPALTPRHHPRDHLRPPLVNMIHLELFDHFRKSPVFFIESEHEVLEHVKQSILTRAFSSPYLMHEVLSMSARHLSTLVAPERASYYIDQSTELQTWALAHFDPAPAEPTEEKCVSLFLFSSLLGIHALADLTQMHLEPEPFFIRFGHYFGLHRGAKTVGEDYSSILLQSELRPLLEWGGRIMSVKGQGPECDSIRRMVSESTTLSPNSAEACHSAIDNLQVVLDKCIPGQPMSTGNMYRILAWPLLIPEKVVDLLILRRPEALVVCTLFL
ncbi:hypothetical protein GGR57DRAFT_471169 [Xylariaceae sp. FL1272]|nr:hypothetical protein GGR57DRAFT_471169 [Xylariaceae sp. FL1272]